VRTRIGQDSFLSLFLQTIGFNLCPFRKRCQLYSAVFQMPEGKLLSYFGIVPKDSIFDLPNGFLGIAYYGVCLTREVFGMKNVLTWNKFIFFASSSALMASIFLAIRLTQLRELCVLCWSTHLINSSLFYVNYKRFNLSKNRGFELNTESEKKSL